MKHRLILFFLLSLIPSLAISAAPEFEANLSQNKIPEGGSFLYTIKAKWPRSESYAFLPPDPQTDNLILLRKGESQEILVEGGKEWVLKTFEIEFKAEKSGQAKIRPFELSYLTRTAKEEPSSNSSAVVTTTPSISSQAPTPPLQTFGKFESPEQTISVEAQKKLLPKVFVGSLAGLGVAGLFFLIFRRKKSSAKQISKPETISIQDSATQKMRDLSESKILTPKEMLQEISVQFRDFLIRYFDLSLGTYSEFDLIRKLNASEKLIEKTPLGILERINESKYAREDLTPEQVSSLAREIIRYIEGTKTI